MAFKTVASHREYTRLHGPGSVVVDGGAHTGWFANRVGGGHE